jgi:carbon monoxide dehydrogenase subunit G
MELLNEFTVPLQIDDAWALLTDVERISKCMAGATILSHTGDTYRGQIKLKVGPIKSTFEGTAVITSKDEVAKKVVIVVEGRDTKANGFAKGTIIASIVPDGNQSRVIFDTNVTLSGRMASFGRQVMSDISNKLFTQFGSCVETELLRG